MNKKKKLRPLSVLVDAEDLSDRSDDGAKRFRGLDATLVFLDLVFSVTLLHFTTLSNVVLPMISAHKAYCRPITVLCTAAICKILFLPMLFEAGSTPNLPLTKSAQRLRSNPAAGISPETTLK